VNSEDGSQDSPAYYAPTESAQADPVIEPHKLGDGLPHPADALIASVATCSPRD